MHMLTPLLRGFKGLKQAIKLEFKLERYDNVRYPTSIPMATIDP